MIVTECYTDGGCIDSNPSPYGGTWSFAHVGEHDPPAIGPVGLVGYGCGVVTPSMCGYPTVENNLMETVAIVKCLEALPDGWAGPVFGDNLNSLRRARTPNKGAFGGCPDHIRSRLRRARNRLGDVRFELIGGHPTRADLARGCRADGKRVSPWNVFCDRMATRIGGVLNWTTGRQLALSHPA